MRTEDEDRWLSEGGAVRDHEDGYVTVRPESLKLEWTETPADEWTHIPGYLKVFWPSPKGPFWYVTSSFSSPLGSVDLNGMKPYLCDFLYEMYERKLWQS